jgi:hypothetical protein
MRALITAAAVVGAFFLAGCSPGTGHPAAAAAPSPPDPHTGSALLRIATAFNHAYDTGDYSAVYARWDARSQAVITSADYVQRHKECPGGGGYRGPRASSPGRAGRRWCITRSAASS